MIVHVLEGCSDGPAVDQALGATGARGAGTWGSGATNCCGEEEKSEDLQLSLPDEGPIGRADDKPGLGPTTGARVRKPGGPGERDESPTPPAGRGDGCGSRLGEGPAERDTDSMGDCSDCQRRDMRGHQGRDENLFEVS